MQLELIDILKKKFLTHAVEFGKFTLSSGKKTDVYINSKNVMFQSDSLSLIGRLIYESTIDLSLDAVGGMESGAIPIISATLTAYHRAGKSLKGFYVRKNAKKHGDNSLIEGFVGPNDKVLIVEDVTTTGKSILKAIDEVLDRGARISRVISLCDRGGGAEEVLWDFNFRPLFKLSDLDLDSLPR